MKRLLRVTTRVFALFVALATLFGMGSAAVAAVTRRRVETTKDPTSNEPTAASVFAGERFESRAPALRGGRVITWFAGHDVDLRGATIDPAGATLDLRTMYGGTQVAIPEGWRVESHVRSLFGGTQVDVHDADLPADAPLLRLRGFSLFGGLRVTTSPDASWSGQDHDGEALPPAESLASTPVVDFSTALVDGSAAAVDPEGPTVDAETAVDAEAPTAYAPVPTADAEAPTADAPLPA